MSVVRFAREAGNTLPLPAYESAGAAGMDLRAFLPDGPITFKHGQLEIISTGLRVELPPGTEMQIRPRSGLSLKAGFLIPNAPGTVDADYRGIIHVGLYYLGHAGFTISHGDRIAQAVIADVRRVRVVEADTLSETDRGADGFGSTGMA